MPHWLNKVDFSDLWRDEPSPAVLASAVAQRLTALKENLVGPTDKAALQNYKDQLAGIIEEFEALGTDEEASVDDFDYLLDDLYTWADQCVSFGRNLCWVKTI